MRIRLLIGVLVILLVIMVILYIYLSVKAEAVCGDERLGAGEECDAGGCAPGEECINCRCVALEAAPTIPTPPTLPK